MFQTYAFQSFAFQGAGGGSVEASAVPTRRDKDEYSYHPQSYVERIKEHKKSAEELEDKLAVAEEQRLQNEVELAANRQKKAIKRLMEYQATLDKEINVLRIERARLMRLIDDEEVILLLMLSMPFH